jgi:hypothetical protein
VRIVSSQVEDMTVCDPAGVRTLTVQQLLRRGGSGSFQPYGSAMTFRTNRAKDLQTTLTAPIVCTPALAGSAVRTELRPGWQSATGWPKPEGARSGAI